MAYAGEFLDYAARMLERVQAGLLVEQAEADAALIARFLIEEKPATIGERDLYRRRGFSFLRAAERRAAAFKVLQATSFIRPKVDKGYGRPRNEWLVNPNLGVAR
jgi:hypothetical protein